MKILADPEVEACIDRMEVRFNAYGLDRFGVSRDHLVHFFTFLKFFYRNYFNVKSYNIDRVPERGRVMVVGNHSGGLPVDGGMVLASLMLEHDPPRLAHGMVEKFAQRWPFVSSWFNRVGQFTGLPEHAVELLESERVLMVFPEGARGTGKLYKDKYHLVRFGTGFLRLALKTGTPIVPFAFIGGEEAIPTAIHVNFLAKLLGAPYVPLTKYVLPFPLPISCSIHYGEPMEFDGNGTEVDSVIQGYVDHVKERIEELIEEGRRERRIRLGRVRAQLAGDGPSAGKGDAP